jgi:hypothetical protein
VEGPLGPALLHIRRPLREMLVRAVSPLQPPSSASHSRSPPNRAVGEASRVLQSRGGKLAPSGADSPMAPTGSTWSDRHVVAISRDTRGFCVKLVWVFFGCFDLRATPYS